MIFCELVKQGELVHELRNEPLGGTEQKCTNVCQFIQDKHQFEKQTSVLQGSLLAFGLLSLFV